MIIKEILSKLENAVKPVVSVMQSHAAGKTLVLGFKKGMTLKEHQTDIPAKLVVIDGAVTYNQEGKSVLLNKFADLDIPIKVPHSVEAQEDSICLLILG